MTDREFVKLIDDNDGNFEVARSIMVREENKNWKCPVCKSAMEVTGQESYETHTEHVTDPNMFDHPLRDKYQCTNKNCIGSTDDVFWDYEGGVFNTAVGFAKLCIDGNNAPFGSFYRKSNVEIYKVGGLKKRTWLHPAWCLWIFQPMIEWTYESNYDGDILKRGYKIKLLWKNDNDEKGYGSNGSFTPCWRTWDYLYRSHLRHISKFYTSGDDKYLKDAFREAGNRAWVYRWFETFIKIYDKEEFTNYKKLV